MTWAARIPTLAGLRYPQASFVLDFANNYYRGSGAQGSSPSALPGYNFTRALAAYAEDTAGNLIQFASGVPRITNKGVLIEESRTNLALQSDARGTSPWTVQSGSVSDSNNLSTYTENTSSATHNTYQSATVSSGATITFSSYLVAGTRRYVQLGVGNGVNSFWITIDTTTWTITEATNAGTSTLSSYGITPAGSGMYRAYVTGALAGQTTYFFAVNGSLSASGVGAAPVYLGTGATIITRGVQFEAGSFPTSYIPTTSASVTRPADVFYYTGLENLSASAITVAASAITPQANASTNSTLLTIGVGSDTANRLFVIMAAGGDNISAFSSSAGVSTGAPGVGAGYSTYANTAARLNGSSVSGVTNGSSVQTAAASPPVGTLNRINIGSRNDGAIQWNSYIQRIPIYLFAASDAQLQSIGSGNF